MFVQNPEKGQNDIARHSLHHTASPIFLKESLKVGGLKKIKFFL